MSDGARGGFCTEELLIAVIARLLKGARLVAAGASSPIPGSGCLLAMRRSEGAMRTQILGSRQFNLMTNGGVELFDWAGQGRLDAFFLGGGQIDGAANVNLVGAGPYPGLDIRWPGSFGSAYLYHLARRVILFREEHTRRVFVPKVDFVSAPGVTPPEIYRTGGPYALITPLCLMVFDAARRRFRLAGVHPGHTVEEVRDHTGFDFDAPDKVDETAPPSPETLTLIRTEIARQIAETYPRFAEKVFGLAV